MASEAVDSPIDFYWRNSGVRDYNDERPPFDDDDFPFDEEDYIDYAWVNTFELRMNIKDQSIETIRKIMEQLIINEDSSQRNTRIANATLYRANLDSSGEPVDGSIYVDEVETRHKLEELVPWTLDLIKDGIRGYDYTLLRLLVIARRNIERYPELTRKVEKQVEDRQEGKRDLWKLFKPRLRGDEARDIRVGKSEIDPKTGYVKSHYSY